jgi:hypothetical protein
MIMENEKLLALLAAIATLKPEDFTKGSGPKIEALSTAFGSPVTAAERDEAWAEVNKLKESEAQTEKTAPTFDKEGATSVVTHRDGGVKRVWFRDGKEIGFENVG